MITPSRETGRLTRTERGAALFATVLAVLLLSTTMVAFMVLGRSETQIAQNARETVQAFFASEAGANHGRWILAQRLRVDLPRQVSATPRNTMAGLLDTTYRTSAGAAQFLIDMAVPSGPGPTFTMCTGVAGGCPEPAFSAVGAILDGQQVALTLPSTTPPYTAQVIVGVHPTIPPSVVSLGDGALFTYVWRVVSVGTTGQSTQQVIQDSAISQNPAGAFTIALQGNFVKYAHFIDNMTSADAYISFRHVYTGPVHTNNRFNILGNAPTVGQEGPTFRSEATQFRNDIRFNNGGSVITVAQDSTSKDWPILGTTPGVLCKSVDCTGLTRNFDFDPNTAGQQTIPFPAGANPQDRVAIINAALGGDPNNAAMVAPVCAAVNATTCPGVIVANNITSAIGANLMSGFGTGGAYVLARVVDLELAALPGVGQQIVIQTTNAANNTKRTIITENRPANSTRVRRQCFSVNAANCNTGAGAVWRPDPLFTTAGLNDQTFIGVFTGNPAPIGPVIWVNSTCVAACGAGLGAIGQAGAATRNGLRRGDPTGGPVPAAAIEQNTRLTVATDGDVYLTDNINYEIDPRGADGAFDSPIPGSGDDNLDVQNTLGVISWSGGVRISSVNNGDLQMQGMFMAANLGGAAAPSGQISFDDPNGPFRGQDQVLGGVVQKTMGTLGSPGSPGTGYSRNWVYDERYRYRALTPPAFPGFPNYTAATGLGIDDFTWRAGRF